MEQVIDTLKDWEIIFQDYYNKKESELRRKENTQDPFELQKLCNDVKWLFNLQPFIFMSCFPSTRLSIPTGTDSTLKVFEEDVISRIAFLHT